MEERDIYTNERLAQIEEEKDYYYNKIKLLNAESEKLKSLCNIGSNKDLFAMYKVREMLGKKIVKHIEMACYVIETYHDYFIKDDRDISTEHIEVFKETCRVHKTTNHAELSSVINMRSSGMQYLQRFAEVYRKDSISIDDELSRSMLDYIVMMTKKLLERLKEEGASIAFTPFDESQQRGTDSYLLDHRDNINYTDYCNYVCNVNELPLSKKGLMIYIQRQSTDEVNINIKPSVKQPILIVSDKSREFIMNVDPHYRTHASYHKQYRNYVSKEEKIGKTIFKDVVLSIRKGYILKTVRDRNTVYFTDEIDYINNKKRNFKEEEKSAGL
jgi:hypothetical protein